jgi:hypothetical protein
MAILSCFLTSEKRHLSRSGGGIFTAAAGGIDEGIEGGELIDGGGGRGFGDFHAFEDFGHEKSRLGLEAFGVVGVGLLVVLDMLLDAVQEVSPELADAISVSVGPNVRDNGFRQYVAHRKKVTTVIF